MAGLPRALRAAGSVLVQVLAWTPSFETQHAFFRFGGKEPGPFHGAHFSSFSPFDASSVNFRVVTCLLLMYHRMESLPFLPHG